MDNAWVLYEHDYSIGAPFDTVNVFDTFESEDAAISALQAVCNHLNRQDPHCDYALVLIDGVMSIQEEEHQNVFYYVSFNSIKGA